MKLIFISAIIIILPCCNIYNTSKHQNAYHIATVNNNVCKKLKGDVILYAVFVDSKYTKPWTTFDIYSTLDSIKLAVEWLEEQAKNNNIPLNIKIDYHQNDGIIPLENQLQKKTLSATLFNINGLKATDKWADKIANVAMTMYGTDTARITKTKIKSSDRERFIARLRDINKTDNVALMYFINNYYSDEISVALHTGTDYSIEYSIVSFKNPGTIIHEFLHLFGALDLYKTPFDTEKQAKKQKEFAMKEFPNEVMAFSYRRLQTLEISDFTKYLIGWENELNEKYVQMLIGKKIKIAKY